MSKRDKTEYEIIITESKSDSSLLPLAIMQIQALSPNTAAVIMNDLVFSIAKHNALDIHHLNANLYRKKWIDGI